MQLVARRPCFDDQLQGGCVVDELSELSGNLEKWLISRDRYRNSGALTHQTTLDQLMVRQPREYVDQEFCL